MSVVTPFDHATTRPVAVWRRTVIYGFIWSHAETGGCLQSHEILDAMEEYLDQDVGGTGRLAWQAPYRGDLIE